MVTFLVVESGTVVLGTSCVVVGDSVVVGGFVDKASVVKIFVVVSSASVVSILVAVPSTVLLRTSCVVGSGSVVVGGFVVKSSVVMIFVVVCGSSVVGSELVVTAMDVGLIFFVVCCPPELSKFGSGDCSINEVLLPKHGQGGFLCLERSHVKVSEIYDVVY